MDEYKGIDYLKKKLAQKYVRANQRYNFYEMKYIVKDLGISTPPDLRRWFNVLGWCGTAVDNIADRISFRTFEHDIFGMNEIYAANNADILFDSGILGALITACDFVYITKDNDGFPQMRIIDGRHATGIIDPVTYLLKEGYAVLETDQWNRPTMEAYLLPYRTDIYVNGKFEMSMTHEAPAPLLVPIIYRPDAVRPFGHSHISRACMSLVQSAVRTAKRSEIAAEFFSFPQRYVLGMDPDADKMDKWKVTMSSLLQIDKDEDGDHPTVGQFAQQSMAPHLDQLRMFAGLFAGETGLTLDDLGFPSVNPSSSDAIKASHDTLRRKARKAQKTLGVGFLNAGYLAACVRDKKTYKRSQIAETVIYWDPVFEADAAELGRIGDAVYKIQQAFPGYFDEKKMGKLTGI